MSGNLQASESEQNLNEVVVTNFYDEPSTSKFHINNMAEDKTKIRSFDDSRSTSQKQFNVSQSLDPSSAYKTSKTWIKNVDQKRTEYSKRGSKRDSNPSQDSAFGSMTEGELSHASSFKLSSFQSMSSPIDEGLEDSPGHSKNIGPHHFITANLNDSFTQSLNDLSRGSNIKETCVTFNPPQLIINDGSCNLTLSPIKKCATSETLACKVYRRSSLEDISLKKVKNEHRIDEAFTPIFADKHSNTYMKCTAKERKGIWKESFLKCNKNNLTIRSSMSCVEGFSENSEKEESNEEDDESSSVARKSERLIFSLIKLKQNAIAESMASISEISLSRSNKCSSSSSNDESNATITSNTTMNDDSEDDSSFSDNLLKTPSHDEIKKFTDCFESDSVSGSEAIPLLGISSSSTDAE
jgi:hypothetical protein